MRFSYRYRLLVVFFVASTCLADVRVRDEQIAIPSYFVGQPERTPLFYTPYNYQNAQYRIYPYPYLGDLSQQRETRNYRALILENEFVEVCILPELGGRIYYARDKTNDYEFVYRNHVIKPALIGMTGAWISGGIEWNIPHHHRATSFTPVDWAIRENADGSKTVWVGESELRHGTRWAVATTLRSGSSAVETKLLIANTTPYMQTQLAWANIAVHANENYQVIFPPDVGKAVFHTKNEFTEWPVAKQVYMGVDFTQGVDVSWWKNTKSPTSFFAYESNYDFMGGLDHGKRAGIAVISDHRFAPGKKFWNWGPNAVGELWDRSMLTDADGSYLELMMGAFSDNQPDYSWAFPTSSKETTFFYYPVRSLVGITNANIMAAIHAAATSTGVTAEISVTQVIAAATVELREDGTRIGAKRLALAPDQPATIAFDFKGDPAKAEVRLLAESGAEILSAKVAETRLRDTPPPYHEPIEPAKLQSGDEIFRAGRRLDQFHNWRYDPNVYYHAALGKDPNHVDTLVQLAANAIKRSDWPTAEGHLRRAVSHLVDNHTRPRENEALYLLGLVLDELGQPREALSWLYRAAWSHEWESAALTAAAKIESRSGNRSVSMQRARRALAANQTNTVAANLVRALGRDLRNAATAADFGPALPAADPLDLIAAAEAWRGQAMATPHFADLLRNQPHSYMEIAAFYSEAGLYADALAVLDLALQQGLGGNPLVRFYRAECFAALGDRAQVHAEENAANGGELAYCFPYGPRDVRVLTAATKRHGGYAAWVLLGHALCDDQPAAAAAAWGRAEAIRTSALVLRNLAFVAANHEADIGKAVGLLRRAVDLDPATPRYFVELDSLLIAQGAPVAERKMLLDRSKAQSVDSQIHRAVVAIASGAADEAIKILTETHFFAHERTDFNLHAVYLDAYVAKGRKLLAEGKAAEALRCFEAAALFPRNLETATDAKVQLLHTYRGLALESLNRLAEARQEFEKSVSVYAFGSWSGDQLPEVVYAQFLAARKLGDAARAAQFVSRMEEQGKAGLAVTYHEAEYRKHLSKLIAERNARASGYAWQAFAEQARGNQRAADNLFDEVRKISPAHTAVLYR